MTRTRALLSFTLLAVTTVTSVPLGAQAPVLRAGMSGRATAEVVLAYPRPAGTMAAMPGMAPGTMAMPAAAPAAAPSTAAAPAPKPLTIRLDYGQPHLRGRTLHSDSLVPWDKMWRTGANSVTTLTTDVDLVLGGATIPKGSYVLMTLPSRSGWKLMVQRNVGQTAMSYADSNDVARIDLRHTALPMPIESLTMTLIPSPEPGAARGELRLMWGTDQLSTNWAVK